MTDLKRREIIRLLKRYRSGDCTSEERALLERWYEQLNEQQPSSLSEEELAAIEARMWERMNQTKPKRLWNRPTYRRAVAAMLLMGLLFGVYRYTSSNQPLPLLSKADSVIIQDIQAAGDRAVLTLPSGEQVALDSLSKGVVAEDHGIRVIQDTDGYLVLEAVKTDQERSETSFHEINTPKAGQYNITLTDGTRVWLGPASSLKYPTRFADNERRVRLEGEAYFEVAKQVRNAHPGKNRKLVPFFVETARQTVQVLGTHFNVSDYQNDPVSRVTLLEGSVRVGSGPGKTNLLSPGQQSMVAAENQDLIVQEVDIQEYLARKEGYFYFNNTELREVLRQLERWYDIDASSMTKLPNNRYSGKLPQDANLSKILQVIEITSGLKFRIESERRLVLKK